MRYRKFIVTAILLLTLSAVFGQTNWRANTLTNRILLKKTSLNSSGIDTILMYQCDSLAFYKNPDTTLPCDQGQTLFAFLFWRQDGKTYMQPVSCMDTSSTISQVDNSIIDYFFVHKISSKQRKKEIGKYLRKNPMPHVYNSVVDQSFYYLTLFYGKKEHQTIFTSLDMASSFWRQFKMFDKEMRWAELIDEKVLEQNHGM